MCLIQCSASAREAKAPTSSLKSGQSIFTNHPSPPSSGRGDRVGGGGVGLAFMWRLRNLPKSHHCTRCSRQPSPSSKSPNNAYVHNGNSEHKLARSISIQMLICNADAEIFYLRCIFATRCVWVKFWQTFSRAPRFSEMRMRAKVS